MNLTAHYTKLSLILFLAGGLRFYNLAGQSLWSDEGNSVALARQSWREIIQRTAFDIHPPLYYHLLQMWVTIFGDSEIGLRSLSAVLGVILVYLTYQLGDRLFHRRVGLIAALIASFSPLQIYYAQEARMYMLLAVLSSLTVLLAVILGRADFQSACPQDVGAPGHSKAYRTGLKVAYLLTVTAGLYTHYAYPLILVVVNLFVLTAYQQTKTPNRQANLLKWLGWHILPIIFYLPWLPTAWRQLTTWPADRQAVSLITMLDTIATTLLFGLSWPVEGGMMSVIVLAVILLLAGWRVRRWPSACFLLMIWLLLTVGLTIMVYSPAFLKFLIVATPALALLMALAIYQMSQTRRFFWLAPALLAMGLTSSLISIYQYHTDSVYARDNYRGIVKFIQAVSSPADAIILHAEGQQDVFNYYYQRYTDSDKPNAQVYPLPRQRPLDEAATLQELHQIARQSPQIYAVYWATHQADPTGLIENWLDRYLFKATDQWYGNVRLVSYASLDHSTVTIQPIDVHLGEAIRLTGYGLASSEVTPGDILQLVLRWRTEAPLRSDYVVFGQVLDATNHLVGQRDALPRQPTSAWPVGEPITDTHGIFIEPGTPPGRHRLIVGLYDQQTGQRLPVQLSGQDETTDFIELSPVTIVSPPGPLPRGAFNIQVPMGVSMGAVRLLGYDWYKLGHRADPTTPLRSGDPVHGVLYWQLERPPINLTAELTIQINHFDGRPTPIVLTIPPAGTAYPLKDWQIGEIVRAQFDLFLSDLEPGWYRLTVRLGDFTTQTKPFQVE